MGDLSGVDSSISTKIVGSDASGVETYPVASSANLELNTADSIRTSGTDTTILLTTSAVELKVGGSALADRKYILMQARDNNIRWGFNTSCNFDLFKNQLIIAPIGVAIYGKTASGTGTIVIGEAS